MQIDFYKNFYKKENSTLQPTVAGLVSAVTVTGILKEPCSILHPVISLQKSPDTNNPADFFRYAYIPLFSRYYWVDDWSWEDGLWTVHLDVDVLATYRTEIGDATEYILRTDSTNTPADFNGAISDGMYPATTDFYIEQIAFTNPFETLIADGTYIVGIISKEQPNAIGAITYYAMTSAQFGTLKSVLLGTSALESMGLWDAVNDEWIGEDVSEQIFKTMYNPYQYITSCMWYPIGISSIPGTSVPNENQTQIMIGWWGFDIAGKRLSTTSGMFVDSVEQMTAHPQAATRGKYLNYAPYTKMTLYGKFGAIPIDTSYLEIGSYLVNTYSVDYITGQCLFQTFVSDNSAGTGRKLISKSEFLIGVPIQIAQIGRDYIGTAISAVEAGKQAVTGAISGGILGGPVGAIAGAISSAGSAIYDTINTSMPQLRTSGINGSFIGIELSTILVIIHYRIVDEDIAHRGRPLCQQRKINTLSGYVLCAEGDIDLNCYDSERQDIRRFLTTGFFWE